MSTYHGPATLSIGIFEVSVDAILQVAPRRDGDAYWDGVFTTDDPARVAALFDEQERGVELTIRLQEDPDKAAVQITDIHRDHRGLRGLGVPSERLAFA